MNRLFLLAGCLLGLFALIAGTVHAHALEGIIAYQINKKKNPHMIAFIKKIHAKVRKEDLKNSKKKKEPKKDDSIIGGLQRTVSAELAAEKKARKIGLEKLMKAFETGALYQFFHALALILTALLLSASRSKATLFAGWFFLVGTLFFSGSLYLYALSGTPPALAPIGGIFLMLGWIFLGFSSLKVSHIQLPNVQYSEEKNEK